MLVKDSEYIRKAAVEAKKLNYQEDVTNWANDQTRNDIYVDKLQPHHIFKQLGKPLRTEEFKKKLRTLLPTCRFEYNEFSCPEPIFGNYKTVLVIDHAKGQYRLPMEHGLIPEFSIQKVKEELVWDPNVTHINRKDMPNDAEYINDEIGWRFSDSTPRPGWKKSEKAWGEAVRGWRTVLLRLVKDGWITPIQAERTFGTADRLTWAAHLGKTHELAPW